MIMEPQVANSDRIFHPRRRAGTKNFSDVPLDVREEELAGPVGQYLKRILPAEIWEAFETAILDSGIESKEAMNVSEYLLSADETTGQPISPIAKSVAHDPYDPATFKFLYGFEDVKAPFDLWYLNTPGAQAIFSRFESIVDRLPGLILSEREKQGLKPEEPFEVFNIGSAHNLDLTCLMVENPELRSLVKITCIDPDKTSLTCGQKYAEEMGVADCFTFVPEKIEDTALGQAHLILFIGMLCPASTKKCILILNHVQKHLHPNGVIIFSTVQEKMLQEGALLDFIMWLCGWKMYFKTDKEPGQIACRAGLKHEPKLDWEDEFGHNRMTVARKRRSSLLGKATNALQLVRALLM